MTNPALQMLVYYYNNVSVLVCACIITGWNLPFQKSMYTHNLGFSILYSWHDYLRRSLSFSVFIHLTAVTQFSSSAKIIDYNYFSLILAIDPNSLPSDNNNNNAFFSWAGSSEIMQILGKHCQHQRWAVWTIWCEYWAWAHF